MISTDTGPVEQNHKRCCADLRPDVSHLIRPGRFRQTSLLTRKARQMSRSPPLLPPDYADHTPDQHQPQCPRLWRRLRTAVIRAPVSQHLHIVVCSDELISRAYPVIPVLIPSFPCPSRHSRAHPVIPVLIPSLRCASRHSRAHPVIPAKAGIYHHHTHKPQPTRLVTAPQRIKKSMEKYPFSTDFATTSRNVPCYRLLKS